MAGAAESRPNRHRNGMQEKAKQSSTPAKSTGLLDLPAEIWTKICKLTVQYDTQIVIDTHDGGEPHLPSDSCACDAPHRIQDQVRQPAITRTCKAIRKETLGHFYGYNTFMFKHVDCHKRFNGFVSWFQAIGTASSVCVDKLYLETWLTSFDQSNMLTEFYKTHGPPYLLVGSVTHVEHMEWTEENFWDPFASDRVTFQMHVDHCETHPTGSRERAILRGPDGPDGAAQYIYMRDDGSVRIGPE